MTAAIANLALNVIMVALLVATIAYCWILNRRIKVLQDSKSELAQLLNHFDESTQRASESIVALQTASRKIGESIQTRIDKANFMLDDLAFMIEKGNKLANQLEASFAVGRARNRVMAEQEEVPEKRHARSHISSQAPSEEDQWEHDLQSAISESLELTAQPDVTVRKQPGIKEKTSASISAMLDRINGRGHNPVSETEPRRPASGRSRAPSLASEEAESGRPRSKVEQELMEIIRAGAKG